MKRTAFLCLIALLVGGLFVASADATPSRGLDCSQCHSFSNQSPVANAGADQTVNGGVTVTLSGLNSTDADDGIASYAWTQTAGTSVTLSGASTATATFTSPSLTSLSTLTFRLTVKDRFGQSATDTCNVSVRATTQPPANSPPVAAAGPDLTVTAGASVTLNGSGSTDPDDGIASYAWTQTGTPAVTLGGASTATASFKAPQVTTTTNLTFTLTVTDKGGLSSSDSCVVHVNPAGTTPTGTAPVADAGLDLAVLSRTMNTLSGFYSKDADGPIAAYSWKQTGGTTVTLSSTTVSDPVFQAPSSPGTLTFQLTVTDGSGQQATDSCTVVVLAADGGVPSQTNQPPVANAGADFSVTGGNTARLNGSASSDPDDGIAIYQWTQVSGTSVAINGAATASATFRAPQVSSNGATLSFRLTVTDRAGLTSSDTVSVQVNASGDDDDDEEDDD